MTRSDTIEIDRSPRRDPRSRIDRDRPQSAASAVRSLYRWTHGQKAGLRLGSRPERATEATETGRRVGGLPHELRVSYRCQGAPGGEHLDLFEQSATINVCRALSVAHSFVSWSVGRLSVHSGDEAFDALGKEASIMPTISVRPPPRDIRATACTHAHCLNSTGCYRARRLQRRATAVRLANRLPRPGPGTSSADRRVE